MFRKSDKGYYFWDEFSRLGLINAFSTKTFGDMSRGNQSWMSNLDKFCMALGIDKNRCIGMQQVHGDIVTFVSGKNLNSVIQKADGLISNKSKIFLLCKTADCVPILSFDKVKKFFGIAHAGWRGAYNEVAKVLLSEMIVLGSHPKDVLIGIGPSIRDCCYNVDENRIRIFVDKFPGWIGKIIRKKRGRKFLSLQNLIKLQAIKEGVSENNIKDSMICSKDNPDFYSFRDSENKNSFERFVGLIGIK